MLWKPNEGAIKPPSLNLKAAVTIDFPTREALERVVFTDSSDGKSPKRILGPLPRLVEGGSLGVKIGETSVTLVPRGNAHVPEDVIAKVRAMAFNQVS